MRRVLVDLPVAGLVALNDPMSGWEWDCEPLDASTVSWALSTGSLEATPWSQAAEEIGEDGWPAFHVGRVAYLVRHVSAEPIELDVEPWGDIAGDRQPRVVGGCRLRIDDGNHRLAAAVVRGDETICCSLTSRHLEQLQAMLIAISAPSPAL